MALRPLSHGCECGCSTAVEVGLSLWRCCNGNIAQLLLQVLLPVAAGLCSRSLKFDRVTDARMESESESESAESGSGCSTIALLPRPAVPNLHSSCTTVVANDSEIKFKFKLS